MNITEKSDRDRLALMTFMVESIEKGEIDEALADSLIEEMEVELRQIEIRDRGNRERALEDPSYDSLEPRPLELGD